MTIFSRITGPYSPGPPSKEPGAEVAGGQGADLVTPRDHDGGAVGLPGLQPFGVLAGLEERHAGLAVALQVRHRDGFGAVQDDGFQAFAAHHRAHAAAPGLAAVIVVDAGKRHAIFAPGSDHRHLVLVAVFVLEGFFDLDAALAPIVPGIQQAGIVIFDEQHHRFGADALQDDAVDAGILHLGGEQPAQRGAGIAAGQGGFAGPIAFARPGDHQAGERAAGDDDLVLRAQRVGMRRHFVIEQVGAEAAPADVIARQVGRGGLAGDFPAAQIHP